MTEINSVGDLCRFVQTDIGCGGDYSCNKCPLAHTKRRIVKLKGTLDVVKECDHEWQLCIVNGTTIVRGCTKCEDGHATLTLSQIPKDKLNKLFED